MDKIYECANNFNSILNTKYLFTIVSKRKLQKIIIDFQTADFRHMSGLRYIDDINIENNPNKLIQAILEQSITDTILEKSNKYKKISSKNGSIKERVQELCYLEEYLDTSDFIKIFEMQDFGSHIKADYFIEATLSKRHTTVYIFIRKRQENDNYVVVSFFKKSSVYKGTSVHWMLKQKETAGNLIELYKHPNYQNT